MTFHVGQKVVCVADDWYGPAGLPLHMLDYVRELPVKGLIYHVRTVDAEETPPYIRLVEIVNPTPATPSEKDECHFISEYFRPVIERKTDISTFTKLLTPNPQRRERVSLVIGEDINTL